MTSSAAHTAADVVNAYFRQFYPPDWDTAWEQDYCVQSYAKRYKGEARTIFPAIVCADGFTFSVQGHFGAYSQPRDDFADRYRSVEVQVTPARAEPLLEACGCKDGDYGDGEFSIYGYVPVEVIVAVIEKHGGIVPNAAITAAQVQP